ncbi:histone-lysine N-methyltransferase SETMAR [Trichonephila clavipes]|uniref:Histone-lysine N-methyltransferase SETMAR n=1 Tax=Trichonephila clavipes TaxID=2585209 RepID=A0A8X7BCS1_TRICX|nr:histone-lysine N-methyltransferase SETMAR [Trichonephila clavipes]
MCGIWKRYCHVRTCQRWFSNFRSGDLSLQESDQSERPSKTNNDVLRFLLENNPHLTCQEIAEEFGIHPTTVGNHIKSLAFVLKRSVWVSHELTIKNLSDRKLLRFRNNGPFCPGSNSREYIQFILAPSPTNLEHTANNCPCEEQSMSKPKLLNFTDRP